MANTKFDMNDTEAWEHMLPAEPVELRIECPMPDDMEALTFEEQMGKEKHLDMPTSWVHQPHIGNGGTTFGLEGHLVFVCFLYTYTFVGADFEERYPNGMKTIHYMRAIHERFAPYRKRSGMVARLTTYDTLDYTGELQRWEWYENRQDLLQVVVVNFRTQQLEEYFVKGRPDCLKCM